MAAGGELVLALEESLSVESAATMWITLAYRRGSARFGLAMVPLAIGYRMGESLIPGLHRR